MKMRIVVWIFALGLLVAAPASAESTKKLIKEGFRLYTIELYGQSAGVFQNVLKQDPDNIYAQYYLGCIHELKGDKKTAWKYYDLAASNPSNAKGVVKIDGKKKKYRIVDLAARLAENIEKEQSLSR